MMRGTPLPTLRQCLGQVVKEAHLNQRSPRSATLSVLYRRVEMLYKPEGAGTELRMLNICHPPPHRCDPVRRFCPFTQNHGTVWIKPNKLTAGLLLQRQPCWGL